MSAIDEEIIRDLLHRYTDNVHPPASIATEVAARQRHNDRRRVVSLTATAAALATAAGVIAVVPGHSSPGVGGTGSAAAGKRPAIKLAADQRVLYRLGVVAARQPKPNGRYAVMSTGADDVKDTSVIDSLTGNMWSYQEGTDGSPSGRGFTRHYSPTAAQFAAMPTDLSALRAALITQWDNQNKPVESPLLKTLPAAHHPIPLPVPVSDDDKVFQQASDILWNPLVGPALRSALYKVLAAVPGVTVNPTARDSTGQPAVEISRLDTSGRPGGKSDGDIYATYESPATGATLESTITYPPGSGVVTPQDPNGDDTVVDTTVYLKVTWASTIPADPYDG